MTAVTTDHPFVIGLFHVQRQVNGEWVTVATYNHSSAKRCAAGIKNSRIVAA